MYLSLNFVLLLIILLFSFLFLKKNILKDGNQYLNRVSTSKYQQAKEKFDKVDRYHKNGCKGDRRNNCQNDKL